MSRPSFHKNSPKGPEVLERIRQLVLQELPVDLILHHICSILPQGYQYHHDATTRIIFESKQFSSSQFHESPWSQTERFKTFNNINGVIDVFYQSEHPLADEGSFLHEERELLYQVAQEIGNFLNRRIAISQSKETRERLKELATINQTTQILNEGKSIEDTLQKLAFTIPEGWQFQDQSVCRIRLYQKDYLSNEFRETPWGQKQNFKTLDGTTGSIEVYYLKDLSHLSNPLFLKEERELLINLARLIADFINLYIAKRNQIARQEREKELSTLNRITQFLEQEHSLTKGLQKVCDLMPSGWQYTDYAVVRIQFEVAVFFSKGFLETPWKISQPFSTVDNRKGLVEVFYTHQFPPLSEGPFLKEERSLINNIAFLLASFLNKIQARTLLRGEKKDELSSSDEETTSKECVEKQNRHLLQNFLTQSNAIRDAYHDLMPFTVKEILLISTLYDAYIIEKEGRFSEQISGAFSELYLPSLPRVTGVSSYEEALEKLQSRHFDLIIFMVGVDKQSPLTISQKLKREFPYIPIYILLNNDLDVPYFDKVLKENIAFDHIFSYNGDSLVFNSMIMSLEDRVNAENDTAVGLTQIILLVEDSPTYYSKYLPLLYSSVLEQTNRIIEDVTTDEQFKILRMRARPKILLATTYEEAQELFEKFRDNLLCVISDVEFPRYGHIDLNAGIDFIKFVKSQIKSLPVIIQSSDTNKAQSAYQEKAIFLNKNSQSLKQDIKSFISHYLWFGDFVYKDASGRRIAVAKTLQEFENHLQVIPDESILYHARKNHFSMWLRARGEIRLSKMIAPSKVSDFRDVKEVRRYLITIVQQHRDEQNRGKIIDLNEAASINEVNVVRLTPGSLGGKGRGCSFINTLLFHFDFAKYIPGINIRAPRTLIIGTDEFDLFLERNNLEKDFYMDLTDEQIKQRFIESQLSTTLMKRLRWLVNEINQPLAIRSSGMFEDSLKQPFAGIFATYLLPNNHPELEVRLETISNAIKLVYASLYSKTSQAYMAAINNKIEDEKMAVVIQAVVGNTFNNYYYPHISGVAQSYNYYAFSHMKPEEGFAVAAVGLGKYVMDGEKSYRFSLVYPDLEINSPKNQFKNSQVEFYAINLNTPNPDLLKGEDAGLTRLDLEHAEMQGTLKHCASVYNPDDNTITAGLDQQGPRIVNFANILKHGYIPFAETIKMVLEVVEEALGSPVEIEFAVDLKKDRNNQVSFYLLQIKPLLGAAQDYSIDMARIDQKRVLFHSDRGMGNGKITTISDIIFVDTKAFDRLKTVEIVNELEQVNSRLKEEARPYILMGPGRWGTRDRFIGIPVEWAQISQAKVIIETSLEDFPLASSSGSHFFHNVTSMRVGYYSIYHDNDQTCINWSILENQKKIGNLKYIHHVRFKEPLTVRMDGKKQTLIVTCKPSAFKTTKKD